MISVINVVGYSLPEALDLLQSNSIVCKVVRTAPPKKKTVLLEECCYVLRQNFLLPTVCQLIVAAKIRPGY